MSITALQVESLPSGGNSLGAWLDDVERVVARGVKVNTAGSNNTGLVDATRRLGAVASKVAAVRLGVVAEVDRRNVARRVSGATSTAAWLRADGMSPGAAHREVRLAGALAEHEPTRQALAFGRINPEQAAVITAALDGLSEQVSDADKTAAEQALVEQATRLDPGQLRKEALARAARLDPGGAGNLHRHEQAAKARRELAIYPGPDGMHHLRGVLDAQGAAALAAALDPLSAPAPADAAGPDPRSPGRRRADALVELARRILALADLPVTGGVRPTVVVTMTLDQLRGDVDGLVSVGCAQIAGGPLREPLSAAAARRIACDAALIPAVLGGPSQVLDLGRETRTASAAQRRALALRDRGCTHPGCDRPPPWCEAHHLTGFRHGARTDLNQPALACDAHHDIAHHDGWTLTLNQDHQIQWHPPPPHHPNHPGEACQLCRRGRVVVSWS